MAPLNSDLRTLLARTVLAARRAGEEGATKALDALAVGHHEPWGSMSKEDRALRNRLRAHGRQLGDKRHRRKGTQEVGRLVHEVAYEHWHRMLFARFLAENHLLIEPDHGVAVSIEECRELAREHNTDWITLASDYAVRMLPQIFRADDPVLKIVLSPESRQELERLLEVLPTDVFLADDSLGWTYQYWQAERKDEVNAAGVKIGADELPAVTQLFTERYMVLFLYHNTIGSWHAGKVLAANPDLAENAKDEEELRQAVRLKSGGGYDFTYLRFVRERLEGDKEDSTGRWRPSAGQFDDWPNAAKEIRVFDPCCGSGHFLTEALELLVRLRMDEGGTDLESTIAAVVTDNLHGLEIDSRCTQIAAFNVALAAWKLAGGPIKLPSMHVACSGLAVGSPKSEWTELASGNERLRAGMERLYELFNQAPELGSLIDPNAVKGDLLVADFSEMSPLLSDAVGHGSGRVEESERAVAAQGMARAAELLAGKYTLVVTNVPYLGRGDHSRLLKDLADKYHREAKADLATIFVDRSLAWLGPHGTVALVTPQNWLFLTSYKRFRKRLLEGTTWNLVARLGENAFQSPSAAGAFAATVILSAGNPQISWKMSTLDVSAPRGQKPIYSYDKARLMRGERFDDVSEDRAIGSIRSFLQLDQRSNPDSMVSFYDRERLPLLREVAVAYQGTSTGDNNASLLYFWEVANPAEGYVRFQGSADAGSMFSGRELIARASVFDPGSPSTVRGREAWGKDGVAVSQTGRLVSTRYTGEKFSNIIPVIIPHNHDHLLPIWCFCEAGVLERELRQVVPKLSVDNGYFGKIGYDLERWENVAAETYPEGLPEPRSDDLTQWLFHGHPADANSATVLQVAVGRLLGYRWPPELDPGMRLATDARESVARSARLMEFADKDGVVCLTATRGERSAAVRLRDLLSSAFGPEWTAGKERELIENAARGKKPAASLEDWLRDRYFEEHCKEMHNRPFIWHIWDGMHDGFHCLVNAHRLTDPAGGGRRTLESIAYSYLGDWIDRQRAEQGQGTEGADARLAAALGLKEQLEKILEGESPYDIFVRWKPLHEQAVGWEPDINDGIRLNIRPFMKATLRTGGKKGAGILRWKPNIKWGKDRGKEPLSLRPREEFPWFWGWDGETQDFTGGPEFDGNRWNDLHYSRACKEAARKAVGKTQ